MKASQLARVSDPLTRFVQSTKFLRSLLESEKAAVRIRDEALLTLLSQGYTQTRLAETVGVSKQMISWIVKKAKERKADAA